MQHILKQQPETPMGKGLRGAALNNMADAQEASAANGVLSQVPLRPSGNPRSMSGVWRHFKAQAATVEKASDLLTPFSRYEVPHEKGVRSERYAAEGCDPQCGSGLSVGFLQSRSEAFFAAEALWKLEIF